jgi:hypothetical protein
MAVCPFSEGHSSANASTFSMDTSDKRSSLLLTLTFHAAVAAIAKTAKEPKIFFVFIKY